MLVVAALPLAFLVGLSFLLTSMPLVLMAVMGFPSLLIIGRTAKRWLDEHRNPARTRQQAASTM
ncbi:MAG: hypothetical protein MUC96_13885 [Myxococcaceae bacterium]|nr:hypothetical protein [Myxococcaceae bacterium]